jgi:guanosine-3',5'-bis(diphosphate) 3'-pyrophosphohydrolase
MISASELIAKVKKYHNKVDEALIQKAYILAKTSHGNQKRHSGDPYFSHPLAVAEILIDLKLDQSSIIAALLHDVVEDTEITLEEIEKAFGEEITKLVDGVTKLGKIEVIASNQRVIENFRKLTIAMSEDIRVLLVKLADRLHNMRTLHYVPSKEKRYRKAQETLDIYAALAGRIGLNKIKIELQELAFGILNQETRNFIVDRLNEIKEKKKDLIDKIIEDLGTKLKSEEIDAEILGREKNPYSIWLKMKSKNVGFHNLYDIIAFRIIVKDIVQCYQVLGIINTSYNMIPGTFKDYISTPKENGYRSIHLVILGPYNKKIEIQIRDQDMHEIAELGLAAHWRYKESGNKKITSSNKKEDEQYKWIRELISLFETSGENSNDLKDHKIQIHKDEVFCFTPNGDVFNLPNGSTAVDFAYAIHSEVGNKCNGVKINGIICPLRQKLENGDQVEIITAKNANPSANWLQFVVTSKAKSAIKHFIRDQKFNEYNVLGRTILNKFFSSKDLEVNDKLLEKIIPLFKKKSVSDLYVRVAEGTISRQEVLKALYPEYKEELEKIDVLTKNYTQNKKIKKSSHSLPIEGLVNGMAINYAGCCNPIPGDNIVGIINTGTGITIHSQSCYNFKNLAVNQQRIIDVCWKSGDDIADELYSSRIKVVIENKPGALANATSILAKKKVNILNVKMINRSVDYFELIFDIQIKNTEHLEDILSALRISKKISEVYRSN